MLPGWRPRKTNYSLVNYEIQKTILVFWTIQQKHTTNSPLLTNPKKTQKAHRGKGVAGTEKKER